MKLTLDYRTANERLRARGLAELAPGQVVFVPDRGQAFLHEGGLVASLNGFRDVVGVLYEITAVDGPDVTAERLADRRPITAAPRFEGQTLLILESCDA